MVIFQLTGKLVVHIPSAVQINEIFTAKNYHAINFLGGNQSQFQYIAASKVILMMEDGELDGYVVKADTEWTVYCTNNIELKISSNLISYLQKDTKN